MEATGKTLYLLRHAKARKSEPGDDDMERPLIKRGRDAAQNLALWLGKHEPLPDLVLCSPSARTRETLALIGPALGAARIIFEPKLYGASRETLLALIGGLPPESGAAMFIGHNPGLERVAIGLAGHAPARLLAHMREKFPTCAMVELNAPVREWSKFAAASVASEFIRPADLE